MNTHENMKKEKMELPNWPKKSVQRQKERFRKMA
jgi:hypothetical protein